MVGIQIDKAYISVLSRHFQLVRWSSINVFGSEIFDRVSFRLPINQWPVHLRIFHERFDIIGRHSFRISASKERRYFPPFLAVISIDLGHSLKRGLSEYIIGQLLELKEEQLYLLLVLTKIAN